MQFSTDQYSTHYEIIGNGSPLILLHGWGCDWQIWSPVIPRLSEKFQLVIPDLPAFGQSTLNSQNWKTSNYVDWLEAFVTETVGNKTFVLLGHSFGGKIAALYAAKKSTAKLKHLILVDSAGIPGTLTSQQSLTQTVVSLIPTSVKESIPQEMKYKILQKFGVATDNVLSTAQQKKILQKSIREDIRSSLQLVKVSTAIIWGENDQETPIENAHQFQELIPNSQLHIFNHTDHFPFVSQPEKFCQIIEKL